MTLEQSMRECRVRLLCKEERLSIYDGPAPAAESVSSAA
jgi:hypothetical protein